jgi:serine/threonine-protein kinase
MGEVYRAYSETLERAVAVKILHDPQQADRFRNEAVIQASIRHPHIATLHEYRQVAGRPCLVMEYVEGPTLDRLTGRLPIADTETLARQIAEAVAHLHGRGIVHRDLKPANVKRTPEGTIKLLDFGIARLASAPRVTRQGYVVGTAEYLAPEQFRHEVTAASDVWSFGVLVYELLTGQLPFTGDSFTALRLRVEAGRYTDPKVFRPQASDRLVRVIEACLRREPPRRPAMAEVARMLTVEPRRGTSFGFPEIPRRYRTALFALAGVGVLGFGISQFSGEPDPPKPPPVRLGTTEVLGTQAIEISVVNASGAELLLPDGTRHPLPYTLRGAPGQTLRATIQAAGFRDKSIDIQLNDRRQRYDYVLEKAF